jgi:hypothetical protein
LLTIKAQLAEEQCINSQLSARIKELEKRNVDNEQDEELEDLLEGCMEELER